MYKRQLTHLQKTPDPVGQSARYLDKLAEYDFQLLYRPGEQHRNADALSRRPCERAPDAPECTQCRPRKDPGVSPDPRVQGSRSSDESKCHVIVDQRSTGNGYGRRSAIIGNVQVTAPPANPSPQPRKRKEQASASDATVTVDKQGKSLMSKELLLQHQRYDPVVGCVIDLLSASPNADGGDPDVQLLRTLDPEIQHLYAQRQSLQLIDGVLYRNYERPDGTLQFQQVVVPRTLRHEFLQATHSGLINGHFGVEKSKERLRQLGYWQGWTEDVRLFVARCNLCNQYRHGPRGKKGPMQLAQACAPMQKLHIDLTGPHPRSSNGYKYILTAICAFTKYLITVPLRDKTSKLVAKALVCLLYTSPSPRD